MNDRDRVSSQRFKVERRILKEIRSSFERSLVLSKPGRIETDRSNEKLTSERSTVRRHQGESIRFTCHIDPVYDPSNAPEWSFGTDNEHFGDLPADVQRENNQLIIDQVKKVHRGYYRCTLNHVSLSALLRVKGKSDSAMISSNTGLIHLDPYAALWPFVGIVIAVIICVVLILLVEKRQKMAKKAAAAAASSSARDGTEDPFVFSSLSSFSFIEIASVLDWFVQQRNPILIKPNTPTSMLKQCSSCDNSDSLRN